MRRIHYDVSISRSISYGWLLLIGDYFQSSSDISHWEALSLPERRWRDGYLVARDSHQAEGLVWVPGCFWEDSLMPFTAFESERFWGGKNAKKLLRRDASFKVAFLLGKLWLVSLDRDDAKHRLCIMKTLHQEQVRFLDARANAMRFFGFVSFSLIPLCLSSSSISAKESSDPFTLIVIGPFSIWHQPKSNSQLIRMCRSAQKFWVRITP